MTSSLPRVRVMCLAHSVIDCDVCLATAEGADLPDEMQRLRQRIAALERERVELLERLELTREAVRAFRFEHECDRELAEVLLERLAVPL